MRLDRATLLAAVTVGVLATGCQQPDVGQRCKLSWGDGSTGYPAPTPATAPGDYLETGNLACDSLVCIVSPATSGEYSGCVGDQCGYCSKPCVSDTECYHSQTGLVCRQMVLDPAFIQYLENQDALNGTHLADLYLGQARYSRYCAVPP